MSKRRLGAAFLLLALVPIAALSKEKPDPINRIFLVGDRAEWVDSGLDVRPQDLITIRTGSQLCFSGGSEESCVRSAGWPRETYAESWAGDAAACDDPFPEWNHATVVARVGEQPLSVGKQKSFTGLEGRLQLAVNDCSFDGDYRNEGQFSVVIVVENPTAVAARSGRELIESAIDAMGGKAIRGVHSLGVRAACTGPAGEFTTEVLSIFPDQTLFKQSSEQGSIELAAMAGSAWRIDREAGRREKVKKLLPMIRGHEFHAMLFELETRFSDHTVPVAPDEGGPADAEAEEPLTEAAEACTRVDMRDEYGTPAAVCLDRDTSLPVRLSFQPGGKKKEPTIHIDLESWTEIDGVRYLQKFTLRHGDDVFTYDYQEIRPNSVDRSVFKEISPRALREIRQRLKAGADDVSIDGEAGETPPVDP